MRALLCIVVAATTAALLLAAAKASSQNYGKLTQLPGRAGCISAAGNTDGCEIFPPLSGASSVAVSPDGRNVYTTGYHGDAVVSFRRDPATGALSLLDGQAACFSKESWGGLCQR